jgi:hypothetical protein
VHKKSLWSEGFLVHKKIDLNMNIISEKPLNAVDTSDENAINPNDAPSLTLSKKDSIDNAVKWVANLANAPESIARAGLMKVIDRSMRSAIVLHSSIAELVELVEATSIFKRLSPQSKAELSKRYEWMISTARKRERYHSNIIEHSFEAVEDLKGCIDFDELIKSGGTIISNARMGTGKTQKVGKPFADRARKSGLVPLNLAHRVSLIDELNRRMGTVHYNDVKNDKDGSAERDAIKRGLSVCLNSLTDEKIAGIIHQLKGRYVLFADEFKQVLQTVDGDHIERKQRQPLLNALIELFKNARAVIAADADMTDFTVRFVNAFRGADSHIIFAKKDISDVTFNVTIQRSGGNVEYDRLLNLAVERIAAGKKFAFYSNRKRICDALHSMIVQSVPNGENLVVKITSDSAEDESAEAFKGNAEDESKSVYGVLISPAITSGISVDNPDYDTAYCIFDGTSIAHTDALQMCARFRNVKDYYVVLGLRSSESEIIFDAAEYEKHLVDERYTSEDLAVSSKINYLSSHTAKLASDSKGNFTQYFVSRLYDLGYTVNLSMGDSGNSKVLDKLLEELKAADKAALLMADDINRGRYQHLKNSDEKLSESDRNAMLRYEVKNVLNVPESSPLTEWQYDSFGAGRGVGMIRRCNITFDNIDADRLEHNEIENGVPILSRRLPVQTKELAKQGLAIIFKKSIAGYAEFILDGDLTFHNGTLEEFAGWVEANAVKLAMLKLISKNNIQVDYKSRDDKKPVHSAKKIEPRARSKVAKDFLSRIGVKFKAGEQIGARGDRNRVYRADFDYIIQMRDLCDYQKSKTDQIEAAIQQAIAEANGTREAIAVNEFDNAREEFAEQFMRIADGVRAKHDDLNTRWLYRCPRCYTPTNGYQCDMCGSHEVERYKSIELISDAQLLEAVQSAFIDKISSLKSAPSEPKNNQKNTPEKSPELG